MNLSELDFTYPDELVALSPLEERDSSRMMVLDRSTGRIEHRYFSDFPSHFSQGDLLVLNDSKVFPGRLIGYREGGGRIECLLVNEVEPLLWECLVDGSARVRKGETLTFSENLSGDFMDEGGPTRKIRFSFDGSFWDEVDRIGQVPLPTYIKRPENFPLDRDRYQTVYAEKVGSSAAPTAGFHFTHDILSQLKGRGVEIVYVTLHVGPGTFLPIRTGRVEDHVMHGEFYEISEGSAVAIRQATREGRGITAVGTTAVRTLESAWDPDQVIKAGRGFTKKFIYPPYQFSLVDRLLTNFHQPRSTLLALVAAFTGMEPVRRAYQEAIAEKYRLFSYGDCLWIL